MPLGYFVWVRLVWGVTLLGAYGGVQIPDFVVLGA